MSDETTAQAPQSTEAELIAVRREKLAKLRELGVDPYGSRFEVTTTPAELRANFEDEKKVKIAGRITAIRDMGRLEIARRTIHNIQNPAATLKMSMKILRVLLRSE